MVENIRRVPISGLKPPRGLVAVDPLRDTVRNTEGYKFDATDLLVRVREFESDFRRDVSRGDLQDISRRLIALDNECLALVQRGVEEWEGEMLEPEEKELVLEAIAVADRMLPWAWAKLDERAAQLQQIRGEFEKRIVVPRPATGFEKAAEVAAAGANAVGQGVKKLARTARGVASGVLGL